MSTSVESCVLRIVSRAAMVPPTAITPETTLATLGIGSLEQIECVLAVEEELKVELDTPELWRTRTVQDVIDAVKHAISANRQPPSS
jgi:acyl carrier protein